MTIDEQTLEASKDPVNNKYDRYDHELIKVSESYLNDVRASGFIAGAEWERERAKKLLEWPCAECQVGEMKQKGYTSPSGLTTYECDRCGHEETYP